MDKKSLLSRKYIIYVGNFLDSTIVNERGLPTFNVAGSNRMHRVANALKVTGQRILIISPAASLRMGWKKKVLHRSRLRRSHKVPIYFSPSVGLWGLNALLEPLFILYSLYRLRKHIHVEKAIVYNYSHSYLFIACVLRYLWRIPVINNVEDVYRPKRSDWSSESDAVPLQQIIFSFCMDALAHLCDGFIIPTKRFLKDLPDEKPTIIVGGCMPSNSKKIVHSHTELPLNILFSGKIEFEHGIHFFVEALERLDISIHKQKCKLFCVNICGRGSKSEWLVEQLAKLKNISVTYHGFVDSPAYVDLLASADICVALQDPAGRYENYKTPSKVYEYLGSGKLVVSTSVGDLFVLPSEIIELCEGDVSASLFSILSRLIDDYETVGHRKQLAAQYSNKHFSYSVVGQRLNEFLLL